jgi:hypothetical protein
VKVLILQIEKGFVNESPYNAAPAIIDMMHTDYRLKSMSFIVVDACKDWELYKYDHENVILDDNFKEQIVDIMNNSREELIQTDIWSSNNYLDDVYKQLKRHRKVLRNTVKGPLVAHGILNFRIPNSKDEKVKGPDFRPTYVKGPIGQGGKPMECFPANETEQEKIFEILHNR